MIIQKKINYSRWRVISLSAVYLLMGIHIAHWKITGNTLAPLEFNEVLYTLHLGILTAGFIFMAITMVATLIAGRFFCSWMCHMLALQDASEWILKKIHIKPVPIRSRTLLWIPFLVMAYLFVWPQAERVLLDLPPAEFHIQNEDEGWASFMTNNFWRNLPGAGITILTFFICGFLIIYVLGSRSFCQSACPYGAIFFMADKIAPGKIKLTGDCNQCGICTSVCSSHIQVHKEIKHFGKVVDGNCLKDLDCVQACPNDAIQFGFTKPALFDSLNMIPDEKKRKGLTLKEDISLLLLFLVLFFIYRGLYDSVPFLLAVTLAIIIASLVVIGFRIFTSEYAHLNKLVLKSSNKITSKGYYLLLLLAAGVSFSIHSGFIQYHQSMGNSSYNKIVAGHRTESSESGSNDYQKYIQLANDHLSKAFKYGLYTPASLNRQLASIYITQNRTNEASLHFTQLIKKLPEDMDALHRYSKLLLSTGDQKGAMSQLEAATLVNARTKQEKTIKSQIYIALGNLQEEMRLFNEALLSYHHAENIQPKNPEAFLASGVLLVRIGNFDEAEKQLLKARIYYPNNISIENNLAIIYLNTKNYTKAIEHLNKLKEIAPENREVKYNLIMAQFALGNTKAALIDMKIFSKKYPDHENAHRAIAMLEEYTNKSINK